MQFAIPHSVLLHPATRKWITRRLAVSAFYGLLFCCRHVREPVAHCSPSGGAALVVVWAWPKSCRPAVEVGFFLSWVTLFYSLSLTGLGYQTGLAPWWHWVRRRPVPPRQFQARRSIPLLPPSRLSEFSGPRLADAGHHARSGRADRACGPSTSCIGSYLKDERLSRLIGEPYRRYRNEVPAFPFLNRLGLLVGRSSSTV